MFDDYVWVYESKRKQIDVSYQAVCMQSNFVERFNRQQAHLIVGLDSRTYSLNRSINSEYESFRGINPNTVDDGKRTLHIRKIYSKAKTIAYDTFALDVQLLEKYHLRRFKTTF